MSFSFNWAGLSVPEIRGGDNGAAAMRDLGNLGMAARGIQVANANEEYADLLRGQRTSSERIAALKTELTRLEQRNADIAKNLVYMRQNQPTAVQPGQPLPSGPAGQPSGYPFSNLALNIASEMKDME